MVVVSIPVFSTPSVVFPVRRAPTHTVIGSCTPGVSAWRSPHIPGVTGPTKTPGVSAPPSTPGVSAAPSTPGVSTPGVSKAAAHVVKPACVRAVSVAGPGHHEGIRIIVQNGGGVTVCVHVGPVLLSTRNILVLPLGAIIARSRGVVVEWLGGLWDGGFVDWTNGWSSCGVVIAAAAVVDGVPVCRLRVLLRQKESYDRGR